MRYYIIDTSMDPRTYNPSLKKGIHSRHKIESDFLKSIIRDLEFSLKRFI